MIDIDTDDLRPVAVVVKARTGKRRSPATIWRWHRKGVKGVSGETVRLECVRVGGILYTTHEAFAEFIRRQNERDELQPGERSAETARQLESAGLV